MIAAARSLRTSIILGIALVALGCGGEEQSPDVRETASVAYTAGVDAFSNRNYPAAAESFDLALKGGLNPDQYCDAMVKRAVCYGATNRYDEALADLTTLEGGAPNLDQVYAARAFVLKKQGKVAEANAAMAKARQYNRMVKEFQ